MLHQDQGSANQDPTTEEWPTSASATGDDGRQRSFDVTTADGGVPDLSALTAGEQLIVHGEGYDPTRGIYVAICVIPDDASIKPGPCVGGMPAQEAQEGEPIEEGAIQYATSNW